VPSGLYPRDLDAFVGLYVWAESDVVAVSNIADSPGISVNPTDVEQESWCFYFGSFHDSIQ
jgi:hypothetical protein